MQIDCVFFRKIIDFTCVYTIFLLPLPRIYEPRSKGRNYFTIMANEKQQFVDELKELLQKNVAEVKEQVEAVKTQFYRQYHQELEAQKKTALEAAEAAGEVLENWLPSMDELEQEFRELLNQYKQRRAELQKQVEEELQRNLLR